MADLHVLKLLVEKSELWVTKKKSGSKVKWWLCLWSGCVRVVMWLCPYGDVVVSVW